MPKNAKAKKDKSKKQNLVKEENRVLPPILTEFDPELQDDIPLKQLDPSTFYRFLSDATIADCDSGCWIPNPDHPKHDKFFVKDNDSKLGERSYFKLHAWLGMTLNKKKTNELRRPTTKMLGILQGVLPVYDEGFGAKMAHVGSHLCHNHRCVTTQSTFTTRATRRTYSATGVAEETSASATRRRSAWYLAASSTRRRSSSSRRRT